MQCLHRWEVGSDTCLWYLLVVPGPFNLIGFLSQCLSVLAPEGPLIISWSLLCLWTFLDVLGPRNG